MTFCPPITDKADAKELRGHLESAANELIELQRTPVDKRGEDHATEVRSRADFLKTFDPVVKLKEEGERLAAQAAEEQRKADERERLERIAGKGATAAFTSLEDFGRQSPGAQVIAAEGYEEFQRGGGTGMFTTEVRALLTSGDTDDLSDAGLWRPVGQPIPPRPRQRRLFVRDLMSVQNTGLSSVPYIKELNATTNETGANVVMEGSAKPEATMEFEDDDAPIRKIAAWIPATTEILADAPTLRGYIDNRLGYMVLLKEEQQVLKGTGTAPQIRGIYETTGTQTQAAVNNDVPATVALSIGKVENADGEADGVVINPITYWTAVATRHADAFDNGYGGNAPAVQSGITWGIPAVRSRALDSLECLVGAFRLGATIFEREGVSVRVGDQHGEYFVYNKVAILAEERVGLAVHRPDWFVETTLDITA